MHGLWMTPPGTLAPHTGNRNDSPAAGSTITVKVIKECPEHIAIGMSCPAPSNWAEYWAANPTVRSYGYLAVRMTVSGGSPPNPPNNWNGLVISEVMEPHPTDGVQNDDDFENGYTRQIACAGSSQWVVGAGSVNPPEGGCYFTAADNSFWDFHRTQPRSYTILKAGHGPVTVCCRQTYKCKDANLTPKFKISRSYANVTLGNGTRVNQVTITKSAE